MATYAISDIHGCYDQFMQLLEKINFSKDDTLYILGDIADRGPKSAEMFIWAVNQAPTNVHFLLGNHELMILEDVHENSDLRCTWSGTWSINGGFETMDQLDELTDTTWRINELIPWLKTLKPWKEIQVNDKPIMLVHAGFDLSNMFPDANLTPDVWPIGSCETVPHGFGRQDDMTMTWIRRGWYNCEEELPLPVICGHTPTNILYDTAQAHIERANELKTDAPEWAKAVPNGRICKYKNRINIDCGCAYSGKLAALRLDDMEEFYVDGYTQPKFE